VSLKGFVETPNLADATKMLEDGRYLWNAGIFLFTAETIVEAFEAHAPDLLVAVRSSLDGAKLDLGFTRLDPTTWKDANPISIDYAVMEKAKNLSVVPFSGKWSDLGDWSAVWRETEVGSISEKGDAISLDCKNSLLRSEVEGQAIVGIGLEDIVAVAMPDAVLISHKDRSQDVKIAVAELKKKNLPQAESFPKDHRPWGWFESLVVGDRFQVKRIVVHPGAALSLQSHHHRAEHWIVVKGIAKVTVDDDVQLISENQSVYIPLGAIHRMENPGKVEMVLIEVQTGSYLGEDDIVRYEDIYARD
jgi:mannose-1-phosphate guanylyltransferase/mannose-6-phosphate isomerase